MARLCACRSPRRNPPPAGKDELASVASTEGSSTLTSTPAVSYVPTPAQTIAFFSDNKLFKQFIKPYLKAQVPGQIKVESESCK